MSIKDAFIAELKFESSLTKKMLEKVPMDKRDWKPHERSMSLGRLATHIAQTTHWVTSVAHIDDFDFRKDYPFTSTSAANNEELLGIFQTNLDAALEDLSNMSDEDFNKTWIVRNGEQVLFQIPKKVAVRGWAFSHMIHHRGQLSVYLRLLEVPVPGMYGPSADEMG